MLGAVFFGRVFELVRHFKAVLLRIEAPANSQSKNQGSLWSLVSSCRIGPNQGIRPHLHEIAVDIFNGELKPASWLWYASTLFGFTH